MSAGSKREAALRVVASHSRWYHTMELAPGVVTPGWCDLRGFAPRVLPGRFDGQRALEIGTYDGFWTFALEDRGAEVVTVDLPHQAATAIPPADRDRLLTEVAEVSEGWGEGFRLVADLRGSRARQVLTDVRTLAPEQVGEPVDVGFIGTMLQHVPDPTTALERVFACIRPGGRLIVVDTFSLRLTVAHPRTPVARWRGDRFTWWIANLACLRGWGVSVGFEPLPWRRVVHRPRTVEGVVHPLTVLEFRRP